MTKQELGREIFKTSHLNGTFLLRSGVTSHEYFDKYQFESRPELLIEIAKHLANILPNEYDLLAGLELGGVPIATSISLETGKPVVFVRKQAKEYGTCKFAEGMDVKGKKLLIVEDVVTSGGQVVISTNDLRQHGAIIEKAICVIDREAGGKEALAKIGIELTPLFTMTELKEFGKE